MLESVAVGMVVGGVLNGATGEVGKSVAISFGAWLRRVLGREVQAPTSHASEADLVRSLTEVISRRPQLAAELGQFAIPRPALRAVRPGLPAPARFFHDRKEALKALDREARRAHDGTPRIALVHGPEGIGTSELPRRWGAQREALYPDGLLHIDLRGPSPTSGLDAGAAAAQLLDQLGLPPDEVPAAADGRCALLRSLLMDRKVLVVLDHAHSAAQITPLITAAPGVFTVAVAVHPPTGLDAVRIPVGPLPVRDARNLLDDLVPAPLSKTLRGQLERCGGSPFAIRALAARASDGAGSRASSGQGADTAVGRSAQDGYRLLAPDEARVHRLLALRPWPSFDAALAALAADLPEEGARRALDRLFGLHLVEPAGSGRFRHRPAVRARAVREVGPEEGAEALRRMVEGYVTFARGAAHAALPQSWRVPEAPSALPDPATALEALRSALPNLAEAVRAAEHVGDWSSAIALCRSLWPLQLKAGHQDALLEALRTGVRLADVHATGSRDAAALHFQLAHSLMELRRWGEAEPEARAAVRDERAAGHVRGEASAVEFLGLLRLRQWRFEEAYDCFVESGRVYDRIGAWDEGADDLPRARALLARHSGRALGGLGRHAEGREQLEAALAHFTSSGDMYNAARARTDLAEILIAAGSRDHASELIEEALDALKGEGATLHVAWLGRLRALVHDESDVDEV
ncbi:tetratricopeptide repeat protein [Streptomyces sp. N35]|uniref:tetratricopeptide repeat protein n=1 Tax=Streptomyces sp. N35 TaxID=2795730 RepID=UPI0018F432F8|nr:tetratricopeptide repeat protein [Streptomyces sp. N35]